ncbi:hypothetical protein E4T42_06890 [Aureobasidium subglaciale]|nr:hypothetical protein E4T38_05167 [Aureobasidium subglaciale]KAI5222032.1 hypothetical protein E4T40_05205 [Aureobasidium subglaciale]KAI5225919.1 hypothetical protein E4T41_05024 [Aureobasidium subglaciale]KAI5245088.1 hypothetical protein E4T42_06890 [Aureobasidium subglaciale]KAI5261971.1 hypothetical protein E4T46_04917 [Aureobasidium subglaciale]
MAPSYNYEYFNVTFPKEYVAQVEINRPEKMNAFNETLFLTITSMHESFIVLSINFRLHILVRPV